MTDSTQRTIEILLVEDSEGDVILTKIAFRGSTFKNNISVAEDGEQATDFLNKINGFEDAVRPDIILLDLNMPKKDGFTVLREIKADEDLRSIPVIVMSSSLADQDIIKSYDLQANGYTTKPLSLEKFAEVVEGLDKFWFALNILPKKESS